MKTKFFDAILDAQKNQKPVDQLPPFDPSRMRSKGFLAAIITRFLENPRWFLRLARNFRPVAKIGPITLVTRHDDVRDILERQDEFQVPFGPEMTEMSKGANFILGMQDGPEYRQMKSACLAAFPPDEVEKTVRPIAARLAREAMQQAEPGFNPVHDLLKMVPARICRDYFGLRFSDDETFADWSIVLSSLFFADFFGDKTLRELAVSAAAGMNGVIARSIEVAKAGQVDPATPLARLVAIHQANPERLSIEGIHAIMMGMVSGFVPTDLLAGGNCLDVLLSKPVARQMLEEAVSAGDDALVDKVIREAMRFKPINIGPLRYVPKDAVVARGQRHERVIKAGSTVMPATFSAMFDDRVVKNPESFNIDRPAGEYLLFGHGIHWCIGSLIARVQIAECMKALFARTNVRRSSGGKGRLQRRGAFPESLHVEFDLSRDARTVDHSMITIVADIPAGTPLKPLREAVDALGNPPSPEIRAALDATGRVHFCSLTVVCRSDPRQERDEDPAQLVFELSADGAPERVLESVAGQCTKFLRPVFELAGIMKPDDDVLTVLNRHMIPVGPFPGSHAGLVFSGTPGHSVERIRKEEELFREVQAQVRSSTASGTLDAYAVLAEVREKLSGDTRFSWALSPAESLLEKTVSGGWIGAFKRAREFRTGLVFVGLAWLAFALFNHVFLFGAPGGWTLFGAFRFLASMAASLVLGAIGIIVLLGGLVLLLRTLLNRAEARDVPDWSLPAMDRFDAIVQRESAEGVQNHLTGLSVMKLGLLRRIALRLVFFVIRFAAVYVFRPGFLASINTIHFARWVLLPGTDRLMFFSNYGGSWESYLEDFITKAHFGLTGVWSNTLGFPFTKNLFQQGATDGDRFKRWARNQQVPTLFWYRAYPETDTRRIRTHSAVRQGLARATTVGEAEAWLSNFGSIAAPAGVLETSDIQSLMFGPMGKLNHARAMAFAVPESTSAAKRKAWLELVLRHTSFGDRKPDREAMICAFSPVGLQRLGLDSADGDDALSHFPSAFRQTMASTTRARINDDTGPNAPDEWLWGNGKKSADALLVIYADSSDLLAERTAAMKAAAKTAGIKMVHEQELTVRMRNGLGVEPFGFADGISQPVIDGTPGSLKPVHPQHRVAAGEFILGYKDQRGYVPPAIAVPAADDPFNILRAAMDTPDARADKSPRDFGRNGSFLVVRQLAQDVEDFHSYCASAAAALSQRPGASGITPQWVSAKIVGRWPDGSSLVRNPYTPASRPEEPGGQLESLADRARSSRPERSVADNDYTFGAEDPQGLRCPLGSHVRRSNPRDSLGEDRETMMEIGKRHRILRVGRGYSAGNEKGLFFMCLNADIERQFEFIQQTWVSAPLFHGLSGERDPLVGTSREGSFMTIPTESGGATLGGLSGFVTMRGGGYFFMPSRRALRFLVSRLEA